jgi:DNA gyrase subunit A|nr:MAG TPA: DNA topoisomerase 2 alpha [Caudoviricetes sp.]
MELTPIIKESFAQYAGAVLQSRALIDVRDCLKPSARQIFYSMNLNKLTYSKPFKKTNNAVGLAMADFYVHGDASCEGVIMRAGQPFAMRYPLVEVEGNYGNLIESGNWAAPRYTESRLSSFSNLLFSDIEKEVIQEWRNNYDDTKQYPSVLASKGFYNIVNGTVGIGVGAAASIPSFNLSEVNNAMVKLLQNPDIDFDEIYCRPDFPTGGIILNEDEVKESLKNGRGKSCKIRSVVEFDPEESCLIVREIPYGVYTNTICGELEHILNNDDKHGIERFNDLTGKQPCIKIYLTKKANPAQVLRFLYKNTSLQSYFGINMTMLENGRFPRVFGWKEALQSHISHEKEVYRKGFEFDLKKINSRIHIIEGILIALANINEVVETIKKSASTIEASKKLQINFLLSEQQAKAVLEIKLSRLAHLEVEKLQKEKNELEKEKERLENILNNEELLNQELINGWNEVARKFGDARRTKVLNIEKEDDEEPIEKKQLVIYLTNLNNIYAYEDSMLISQRRGGVGTKLKLSSNEFIKQTITETNYNNLLAFTDKGKVYNLILDEIELNVKTPISSIIELEDGEIVSTLISDEGAVNSEYILFITKNGTVKKTELKEYRFKKNGGISAIKLRENDYIKNVFLINTNDCVGIASKNGYFVYFSTNEIPSTGRTTIGLKGINLKEDEVCGAIIINDKVKEIVSVTKNGFIKKTPITDFSKGSRGNKGVIVHKLDEDDEVITLAATTDTNKEILVSSLNSIIKFSLNEVQSSSRNTIGTHSIRLRDGQSITGMVVI